MSNQLSSVPLKDGAGVRFTPKTYKGLHALYVYDRYTGAIDILSSKTYRDIGAITGAPSVTGLFLDKLGNLYAAGNSYQVFEYAPGATSPSFTYNADGLGLTGDAVDAHGNVFMAMDHNNAQQGWVQEFFQGVSTPVFIYGPTFDLGFEGIAVDAGGNVFVSTINSQNKVDLLGEFEGGLHGSFVYLPFVFPSTAVVQGIALDKNENLVVCDSGDAVVDVLAPPYTSVTRTIGSGFINPSTVTLNKANTEALVSDPTAGTVTIVNYQTGTNIKTLGLPNGLNTPGAVVEGPNAVY